VTEVRQIISTTFDAITNQKHVKGLAVDLEVSKNAQIALLMTIFPTLAIIACMFQGMDFTSMSCAKQGNIMVNHDTMEMMCLYLIKSQLYSRGTLSPTISGFRSQATQLPWQPYTISAFVFILFVILISLSVMNNINSIVDLKIKTVTEIKKRKEEIKNQSDLQDIRNDILKTLEEKHKALNVFSFSHIGFDFSEKFLEEEGFLTLNQIPDKREKSKGIGYAFVATALAFGVLVGIYFFVCFLFGGKKLMWFLVRMADAGPVITNEVAHSDIFASRVICFIELLMYTSHSTVKSDIVMECSNNRNFLLAYLVLFYRMSILMITSYLICMQMYACWD